MVSGLIAKKLPRVSSKQRHGGKSCHYNAPSLLQHRLAAGLYRLPPPYGIERLHEVLRKKRFPGKRKESAWLAV